jgi:hypothetical protein
MLAVSDRREIRVRDGDLSRPKAQTPRPVFRAAYRELCARIWIELELLAQAVREHEAGPPLGLVMSTEILRLELVVLVDACRSPHWRCMLAAEQCEAVCSMLTDVLAALYVDSEYLRTGITEAQDRVLDELLPESEAGTLMADRVSCELGQGAHLAAHALMSLIEGQAVARASR